MKQLELVPDESSIVTVAAFFESEFENNDLPFKLITHLNIVVDEAYVNIVQYSGATSARVGLDITGDKVILYFSDNGTPYNPTVKPDPDVTLSAEERQIGGLGIFMVKKLMDTVEYNYAEGMNNLILTKMLS